MEWSARLSANIPLHSSSGYGGFGIVWLQIWPLFYKKKLRAASINLVSVHYEKTGGQWLVWALLLGGREFFIKPLKEVNGHTLSSPLFLSALASYIALVVICIALLLNCWVMGINPLMRCIWVTWHASSTLYRYIAHIRRFLRQWQVSDFFRQWSRGLCK